MDEAPVFISYHNPDYNIATKLDAALRALSPKFKVFLDKKSIAPSQDYRAVIREELKKAQWLLIICTGFPRPDTDFGWSYFEAGQFLATLPAELQPSAEKRIVCLYDADIPPIFSPWQGVKITSCQKGGAQIDLSNTPVKENIQYDDTFIYDLFKSMLLNEPQNTPIRDPEEPSVKGDIRVQCKAIIDAFAAADGPYPIQDYPLQPRLSYQIRPTETLNENTKIAGYQGSLKVLFSIANAESTWGELMKLCCAADDPKPQWIVDAERASVQIGKDVLPTTSTAKAVLNGAVYRIFTARYELFKNKSKIVYISFIPATSKTFDLKQGVGVLLSALILSIRFREQLIPMAPELQDSAEPEDLLSIFYERLLSAEMEAQQFGLRQERGAMISESPLLAVIRDDARRDAMQQIMVAWKKDREQIQAMFLSASSPQPEAHDHAVKLAQILLGIRDGNRFFIKALIEELHNHMPV